MAGPEASGTAGMQQPVATSSDAAKQQEQQQQQLLHVPARAGGSRLLVPGVVMVAFLSGLLLLAWQLGVSKAPFVLPERLRGPNGGKLFTLDALSQFDGDNGKPYYLAILGEVYDVTPGKRFYAKGEGYNGFIGRDASRSFVTGDFVGDLTDNVADFDEQQCGGLLHWRGFFRNHMEYKFKGRLIGAFFDATGRSTPELARVERLAALAKSAEQLIREAEAKHPGCNSRWNQVEGGWVWCDDGMYPRKITSQIPGASKPTIRCACFKDMGWSDVRQVYPDCKPDATECRVTPPGPAPDPFAKKRKEQAQDQAAQGQAADTHQDL